MEKTEEEKKKDIDDFKRRWDFYVQSFVMAGFTQEQAERLAREFSEFKTI